MKKNHDNKKKETSSKKITGFSGAEYLFSDSSVEPRYARSWSVTVDGSKATFVIRSYETILIKEEYNLTQEQTKLLSKVIPNLEGLDALKHNGESGSTAEGLTIFNGNDVIAEAYWNEGANASITDFRNAMKSIIPNFDELMQSTVINSPISLLSDTIPEDVNLEEFNTIAQTYDFKIIPDKENEKAQRIEINALRTKLIGLVRGEDWMQKFEEATGNKLDNFNL